ncbi:MAG: DUF4102 domain-containing protein [Sphingomonadales bacterium]|nr:MAG: DUF4102 domain-containing protein [Sphingomonadales bacterium]
MRAALNPLTIATLTDGHLLDSLTPGLSLAVLPSGKKKWRYCRRVSGSPKVVKLSLGGFPAYSLEEARAWASKLNYYVERGEEPRQLLKRDDMKLRMTVATAHALYMRAALEGRATRAKRLNRPRTIADKRAIYNRDIAPFIGHKIIHNIAERELVELVLQKGSTTKVRANRLAAELKTFFGWASGLRGLEVGLALDPSRRLADLRFPEASRDRQLSIEELGWFLRAVTEEPQDLRRGMLLWLLTAARISEVIYARREEIRDGIWTIPATRSKNSRPHQVALGPWAAALMASSSEWVFPAQKVDGPRKSGWYPARDRVLARMSEYAGRPIERFTPHDFRRTARSNTKRLGADHETAEAMLNHVKHPLMRIYDSYDLADEKAAWFRTWEIEIASLAKAAEVADKLEIPNELLRMSNGGRWLTRLGGKLMKMGK